MRHGRKSLALVALLLCLTLPARAALIEPQNITLFTDASAAIPGGDGGDFSQNCSGPDNNRKCEMDVTYAGRGLDYAASVDSRFQINDAVMRTTGSGSATADIARAEAGVDGAYVQSIYVTNVFLHLTRNALFDWSFDSEGQAGPIGSSDGLDNRVRVLEFFDSNYAVDNIKQTLLNEFMGAGQFGGNLYLAPGFYEFRFQGRVLYNYANESNRDGAATWSYLGFLHQVPEPGTLALLGLGVVGLGLSRRRKA